MKLFISRVKYARKYGLPLTIKIYILIYIFIEFNPARYDQVEQSSSGPFVSPLSFGCFTSCVSHNRIFRLVQQKLHRRVSICLLHATARVVESPSHMPNRVRLVLIADGSTIVLLILVNVPQVHANYCQRPQCNIPFNLPSSRLKKKKF